jgi:hypothetical protein
MLNFNRINRVSLIMLITIFLIISNNKTLWCYSTPYDIVKKYCELDYNGARTPISDSYNQIIGLYENEFDEPGWDTFIVVSGFDISSVQQKNKNNTVTIKVSYNNLIELNSTPDIKKFQNKNFVDFILKLNKNSWKIVDPIDFPRISKVSSLKLIDFWIQNAEKNNVFQGETLNKDKKKILLNKLKTIKNDINKLR